ncbi:hypothetical protein ABT214_20600 [Micromonospora purpureochromogenes]|uniref:hypothetical protein n=1 Tax=Micromonospora purpureochromogenes TaxID=47872 RepID=UPI00332A5C46
MNSQYDQAVWKRLLDYYGRATPWSRQLWRLSTPLEIDELLEAGKARHSATLSDGSIKYLMQSLAERVKRDVGIGDLKQRGTLVGHLAKGLTPEGHNVYAIQLLAEQARANYLERWAAEARKGKISSEVVSRAVGSYLLDIGFSQDALHKWWTYHGRHSPKAAGIADLIEEAATLSRRPKICFDILVPITSTPPLPDQRDPAWLDSTAAAGWLSYWFPGELHPRQTGALLVEIEARDVYSAVEQVAEVVTRLTARFRVGTRQKLVFHDELFVVGEEKSWPYIQAPRRVEVHALHRTSAIFDLNLSQDINAALELLEPLDSGTPAAAIAGSWAAIEALFVGPGDTNERVVAATRMARIVACSYVRAELTALANGYAISFDDSLAGRLRALNANFEKALAFEGEIRSGNSITFKRTRHKLALDRMTALIAKPENILPKIVGQLEDSFRRLYRQRNLVVHAGDLTSVALRGTLRTVAPLVGAGIDRIVHASAVGKKSPIELSAIAEVNLASVGEDGKRLVLLLS